jgi:CRP-like cAMP-binding protein
MLNTTIDQEPPLLHSSSSASLSLSNNRLLSALPLDDFARLSPLFVSVPSRAKQRLQRQGEVISHVYFPTGGTLSLVKTLGDGHSAEIATIGNEGMIGTHVVFGEAYSPADALVQVANGELYSLAVDVFNAEMNSRGAFYNLIIRYCAALTNQIMQTSVCNSLHSVEQRTCRWLLLTHERVGMDEFPLTHDFLAEMLGVRRSTITLIAGNLQRARLVGVRRGRVTILDRDGLEAVCCECYVTMKSSFSRLLPQRLRSS